MRLGDIKGLIDTESYIIAVSETDHANRIEVYTGDTIIDTLSSYIVTGICVDEYQNQLLICVKPGGDL